MSVKAVGRVWELVLTPAKQIVLLALADHADHDGGSIKPGVPLIAWKTGYSERQVQRIIQALEADGLLVAVKTRAGLPTEYQIEFSKGVVKPPYVRRKPRKTPDKMSPPDGDTHVTPDKMSPVTSHGKNDSQGGDIASANLSRIRHKDDPNDQKIAPGGAPVFETDDQPTDVPPIIPASPVVEEDSADAESLDDTPLPYPCTAADINALIAAWWEWVPTKPTKRGKVVEAKQHFANKTNREFAQTLIERGVMTADMINFLAEIRFDPESRWANLRAKELTFDYAMEALQDWVVADREENIYTPESPRITARKPGKAINLGEIHEGDNLLERFKDHPDVIVDVPRPYLAPQPPPDDYETPATDDSDDAARLAELGIPL